MSQSIKATSVKSSTPVLSSSSVAGQPSPVKDSVKDAGRVHVGGGMMRF